MQVQAQVEVQVQVQPCGAGAVLVHQLCQNWFGEIVTHQTGVMLQLHQTETSIGAEREQKYRAENQEQLNQTSSQFLTFQLLIVGQD